MTIDWFLSQRIRTMSGGASRPAKAGGWTASGIGIPRSDSPRNPQHFFPTFSERDILLIAPVIKPDQVGNALGKPTALPLTLKDACASLVRAL